MDYIGEEEEDQDRIFEEDQKRGYRDKRRKRRREKRKKEKRNFQHKVLSKHAQITTHNILRHEQLRSTNEKSIFKKRKKVANGKLSKCKKEGKLGRRGRFSPSMLSAIYPAKADGEKLTIGRLSIR